MRILFAAAGVLCLLFGLAPMFMLIFNFGVAILLSAAAVFLCLSRFWDVIPHRPKLLLLAFLSVCFVLALALSSAMVWHGWFNRPPPQTETLVVLGGKIIGDQPTLMVKQRLDVAADYLLENPNARCVASGGQGSDEDYPEAQVMAWYLESRGISPERILLEDRSTNTWENLTYSHELLQDTSEPIIIVTSGYHQMRASILAKKAGFTKTYALSSVFPWGLGPAYWAREWLGIAQAWLQ